LCQFFETDKQVTVINQGFFANTFARSRITDFLALKPSTTPFGDIPHLNPFRYKIDLTNWSDRNLRISTR